MHYYIWETVLHLHATVNTLLQTDQSQSWLSQQCHTCTSELYPAFSANTFCFRIQPLIKLKKQKQKNKTKKLEICGTIIKKYENKQSFEKSEPHGKRNRFCFTLLRKISIKPIFLTKIETALNNYLAVYIFLAP